MRDAQTAPRFETLGIVVVFADQYQRGRLYLRKVRAPSVIHAIGRAHDAPTVGAPARADFVKRHQLAPHCIADFAIFELAVATNKVLPAPMEQKFAALQYARRARRRHLRGWFGA